jgi:potassium efflux system protein
MIRYLNGAPSHRGIRILLILAVLASCMFPAAAMAGEGAGPPGAADAEGSFSQLIGKIWRYDLFKLGESRVQLNQIIISLAILIGGIWLSRRATRLAHNRLSRHFDASVAAALQKVIFYLLMVLIVYIALDVVHIPLGVFAFLGGALAIGLGFGAQNIINNFISGLILMVERPIRIGDLLEVEGDRGRVMSIGYRCTLVRRTDGIDVLVPNSTLLEKNVVNWTLSDKRIRTSVVVGVAYGSPTGTVASLMRKAVDEHERILADPEPNVIFQDFGDSALVFQVYFWSEVETFNDLRQIRSDLRFRIDELFREGGITIAFPQRDAHLDTLGPLEVRVVHGGSPGGK